MEENSVEEVVATETISERVENLQEESEQVVVENPIMPKDPKTKNWRGTILTIVLLVAVAALYILFFTKKEKTAPIVAAKGESSGLVLTVNNDSIVEYFVLVEILKSDLEKETTKYQAELQKESAVFEEKYRNFEINVQNNILTQTQIQNTQALLQKEAERLQAKSAKYTEIISKKELSVHREVLDSITHAIKRVNDAHYKADYVFATSETSLVFYANPDYDITKQVIEELNNAYNKTHKK